MSLKAVHLLFVILCTLLNGGLGYWAFRQYRLTGESGLLWLGGLAVVAIVGLTLYFPVVLRKLRDVSLL